MTTTDPAARLSALAGRRDLRAALALFDDLPAVSVAHMQGTWRGSGVDTGHPFDGLLEEFGWRGKRFDGPEDAHPLVFENARGQFCVNPAGMPLAWAARHADLLHAGRLAPALRSLLRLRRTRKPKARLRMMEYRGVTTGTMSYDALPVNDHFRKVDGDTLIGVMDARAMGAPFVFVLRRDVARAPGSSRRARRRR